MSIYRLSPESDGRWASLVASHPRSSVFHTLPWLEALRKTYGHAAVVFTLCPPDRELTNGILFAEVNSWLTGVRLVSMPYSDHCDPLVSSEAELSRLLNGIGGTLGSRIRYAEVRPRSGIVGDQSYFEPQAQFLLHVIDLQPPVGDIYSLLHRDSVRRKIRRAGRENVGIVEGRSESLLREFYELLLLTRRRHRLPPQPFKWFRNLADCFGEQLTVRVARLGGRPIASMITIGHKKTLVFKYGCSDARVHNVGAVPALFWRAIRDAKQLGFLEFDLGRSELANKGLIVFKEHLGAKAEPIGYWRTRSAWPNRAEAILMSLAGRDIISHVPDRLLRWGGKVFYRHSG
jgi:CelD/BcsL family acetyltransferase involved in cellulose biosynthesis